MFFKTGSTGSTSSLSRTSTPYSDRFHDFSVTIARHYKDVYVNSSFVHTARPWNSLPIERFPLTYDLNEFKSSGTRHLLTVGFFLRGFPVSLNLFVLLLLVGPCLVVIVHSCIIYIYIYIYIHIYIYKYIYIYIYREIDI